MIDSIDELICTIPLLMCNCRSNLGWDVVFCFYQKIQFSFWSIFRRSTFATIFLCKTHDYIVDSSKTKAFQHLLKVEWFVNVDLSFLKIRDNTFCRLRNDFICLAHNWFTQNTFAALFVEIRYDLITFDQPSIFCTFD